ncbi:hypothetical protein [Clostridium sp.]|jgi:hypothetical protein|uniref:hypothetical protein n=1 Tax=Clostridium sp. TaxID=1506 RepID=UPI002FDD7E29
MDIYNEIVSKIHECESKKIPISDFGHKYGFKNVNLNHKNEEINEPYICYKAQKENDGYIITLEIETEDNYRSFGNDEEPYRNKITVSKNGKEIQSKTYVYVK